MAELSLMVKLTLVLAVALVAARLAGRQSAAVRSLMFACTFGLLLLLPVASVTLPSLEIEVPAAYSAPLAFATVADITPFSTPAAADNLAGPSPARFRMPSMLLVMRLAWAAGAVAFMTPLVVGLLRLRRLRARGRPWLRASLLTSVDVLLHDAVQAPMTYGVLRPVIVLPTDAPQWDQADLRRALLHELEHVRRRDWPLQMAARATCALYWFHPLAWIALRQLCLESERACDDAVLRQAEGTVYAAQLVSLARRLTKRRAIPLLSMANQSSLSTRVGAVLADNVARGRVRRLTALVVTGCAIAVALTISPLRVVTLSGVSSQQSPGSAIPFAVTSIRRTQTVEVNGRTRCCQVRYTGGRMTATNVGLADLIGSAYGVYHWQIVGAPPWAGFEGNTMADRFDVETSAGRDAGPDVMRQMLQTMLADRFRLAVHRETRTGKVYELVVEPGGHKLPPPGAREYNASEDVWMSVDPTTKVASLDVDRMTMAQLTRNLGSPLNALVLDRTGLAGVYKVGARWTLDGGPTIFDAFPEQLGLRLRETTGPVDYLVVDRADRPTPNQVR